MEPNSPADEPAPAPPAEAPVADATPVPPATLPVEEAPAGESPNIEASLDEVPPEDTFEAAPEGTAPDELTQLAEASQKARLSPSDEERMGSLLKEALLGGRAGVARAVDVLPRVPWIVGVRAVETVWPELTAGFRTQLLSGLGKEETDAARRIRLSLARALFKLDIPVALKLAVAVA